MNRWALVLCYGLGVPSPRGDSLFFAAAGCAPLTWGGAAAAWEPRPRGAGRGHGGQDRGRRSPGRGQDRSAEDAAAAALAAASACARMWAWICRWVSAICAIDFLVNSQNPGTAEAAM